MLDSATIKIFLPQGDPKKIRIAELSNWSGKAIASPRSEIERFLSRPEISKPGIYILLGIDPESGNSIAYIGEAEILPERIKQHKSKDDWNSVIAFFSKDENLTKSHIRYLEGRLIDISSKIGRYKITNKVMSGAHLPEADQHEMEVFLSKILQLLPILGTELTTPVASLLTEKSNFEMLYFSTKNVSATGFRSPNGFVIAKGSTAVLKERESAQTQGVWVISLRQKLIADGALVESLGSLLFTEDVEFGSPSAAAAVVQGGTAQGTVLWKNGQGKTLKEIESNTEVA
jgi:hypothetical protein